MRRRRPPSLGRGDPPFQIRESGRHLGIGRVGHAPAFDLDGAHAAKARGEQRVALRDQFVERHAQLR